LNSTARATGGGRSRPPFFKVLEHEPHVHLHVAAGTRCGDKPALAFCPRHYTVVVSMEGGPLGVIEDIERIRAELQLPAFAERVPRLLQPHVPVVDSGLAKVVPMLITPSHCIVVYALTGVVRVRAGSGLHVAVGVESAGKGPVAARKITVAVLDGNIPHVVVRTGVAVR